jgi:hypothetical protein
MKSIEAKHLWKHAKTREKPLDLSLAKCIGDLFNAKLRAVPWRVFRGQISRCTK